MVRERFQLFVLSLLSRKFLMAAIGFIFTAFNYILDWGLTEAQIALVLAPLGTFILAEGAADVAGRATGDTVVISKQSPLKTAQNASDDDSPDKSQIYTGSARQRMYDERLADDQSE